MTRVLTGGMQTAIAAQNGVMVNLIEMQFSTGTLRISNAPQNLVWNGLTWTGIGGLVSVTRVNETGDLSGWGADIELSGVDQTVIALLLGAQYIGRSITVWDSRWDIVAGTVIVDPSVKFGGYMNGSWTIDEQRSGDGRSGGSVKISTRCSDRLAGLEQRRGIQPNASAHQVYFPGDLFFQMIGQVAWTPIIWK